MHRGNMHAYVQEFECQRMLGLTRKFFLTSLSYESSQNYFQMMLSLVNWRATFLALMSPVLPSIRLVSTQPSAATILQKVLRIYVAQYSLSRLTSDSIIYLEVSNIWLVRCMSTGILFLRLASPCGIYLSSPFLRLAEVATITPNRTLMFGESSTIRCNQGYYLPISSDFQ